MTGESLLQVVVFLATAVLVVPLFKKLKQAPILGFLAAGVILGPSGAAWVSDPDAILHFAELGVVFMLFLLGLELSPKILWQLRHSIFLLGGAQLFVSAGVIFAGLYLFNLNFHTQVFLSFALALSSTAFAVQLMTDHNQLSTPLGRDGFSVLLFQDLAVIPLLLMTAYLGSHFGEGAGATETETHLAPWYVMVATLIGFVLAGRWGLPWLLRVVADTHVRELQTALALLLVIGSAWWMEHLGLSMGLGAFAAGVLLANSHYRHELESDIEPFKGLLLGLFFMAVGMTMPLSLLLTDSYTVIGILAFLLILKTAVLTLIAKYKGHSFRDAVLLGSLLSEGGEFAFVLLTQAQGSGLIDKPLAGAAVLAIGLSMIMTPWLYSLLCYLTLTKDGERAEYDDVENQKEAVVIAGFGRFGQIVGRLLSSTGIRFIALDKDASHVDVVRKFGNEVYYGDAARLDILKNAGVSNARVFVLAIDDVEASVTIASLVSSHFPNVTIVSRARNRRHAYELYAMGVKYVYRETFHTSLEAAKRALLELGLPEGTAAEKVSRFKGYDIEQLRASIAHKDDLDKLLHIAKEGRKELETLMRNDAN
ncbi:MAG: cation:proton antiporter [Oleispira sp.]|nr:cation:proton antiporter [Oleispira sp.]